MRILASFIKAIIVFSGTLLVVGGVFATSYEIHARAKGNPGALRRILENPQEIVDQAKAEIAKITAMFQPDSVPRAEPAQEQIKPQTTESAPPARPAPQQSQRTAPAKQPQPQRQPVPAASPVPRPTPNPAPHPVGQAGPVNADPPAPKPGAVITRAELQEHYPEGQIFFFSEDLTHEIVRQVNEARIAHGRKPLKLHPRLVESAKAKVADMLTYRYQEHDSPRLGNHHELIFRHMFPAPFADFDTTIRSQSLMAGENLQAYKFAISPQYSSAQRDSMFVKTRLGQEGGAVQLFMNSPSHRATMLNDEGWDRFPWHYIGVATGYTFWHDHPQEHDPDWSIFTLTTGERYVVRLYTKHAMHFAVSVSPHYTPAEEFLRLNPDIRLRVQGQGQPGQ